MRISKIQIFPSCLLCWFLALAGSADAKVSSADVLEGLSGPARIIIASVNSNADADWVKFCSAGAPTIQEAVTRTTRELIVQGKLNRKIGNSAVGETRVYHAAGCLEEAGAPGRKSVAEIHKKLREPARHIVAEVKSEIGSNITGFCGDSGSGITMTVTNVAIRMVEDEEIAESDAYGATDEFTKFYIAFRADRFRTGK